MSEKRKNVLLFWLKLRKLTLCPVTSSVYDIGYSMEFTCDIDPEGGVSFAIIILSSAFIIAFIS